MLIYPAIDILGGKVVRLYRGDYGKVTPYSLTCAEAARRFQQCGARYLHAVDLDGAKSGGMENAACIGELIASTGLKVEIGGGIRTEERVQSYLSAGAHRVILGTAAVRDPDFAQQMAQKYGDKIAVAVDAAEGKVAAEGWRSVTKVDAVQFCRELAARGVRAVIYTDISRDGAMQGANLAVYGELVKIKGLAVTASGGVTFPQEIAKLRDMGVYAVILGKALYEGALDLKEAIALAGRQD